MNFQFDANKAKTPFSWWQVLIFALLFLGFLIFLFPKKLFINTLLHNSQPSRVSISYLRNLIAKEPTNLDLNLNLADQEFQIGEIQDAKQIISPYITMKPVSEFQWKVLSLYYQITRVEAFEIQEKNSKRHEKEATLKTLLLVLMKSPYLNANEQANLAEDALAFDLPQVADSLYKLAISKHIEKPAAFFAKAAMASLFVKEYQNSAQFYLLAMQRSATTEEKRAYFIKGIDSLNAGGVAQNALEFAQKNIDGLTSDKNTLIYLAKLALKSSQQKVAEHYVNQILQIQYQASTE